MSKAADGPGLYPAWVRRDPTFARELLALIAFNCSKGAELSQEERGFLAEAIGKILRGVPPKRALYLSRRQGRQRSQWSERNIGIFNQVQALIDQGHRPAAAYRAIARKQSSLSADAVEKIYRTLLKAISPKK